MTGEGLAEKVHTDKGTISRIENGQAGLSTDRLQDIAAALGLDPAALLAPAERSTRAA
jgi:transcriptional regulator with XRE-family HTH domain